MKKARKRTRPQTEFRRAKFAYNQYWKLQYTEKYSNGSEKDFFTFIKAKSYSMSKDILISKIKELDSSVKVKAIQGFMFHKDFRYKPGKRLNHEMWSYIKDASFPNFSNTLFKKNEYRDPSKSNRFNSTDCEHLKKIGFKKGAENWSTINRKGKTLPISLRQGKVWRGDRWEDWDKDEMKNSKHSIISALIYNNNNRTKTAAYLGMDRNTLYRIMSRIPKVDWLNDFPTSKPFSNVKPLTDQQKKARSETQKRIMKERMSRGLKPFAHLTDSDKIKRLNNFMKSLKKRRDLKLKELLPKMKSALDLNNNIRSHAAKSIGMSSSSFNKWMAKSSHLVDWNKKYPSPYK
jgi:hypothetical protein